MTASHTSRGAGRRPRSTRAARLAAVLATAALMTGGGLVAPIAAQASTLPAGCDASGACSTSFDFNWSQQLRTWTPPEGATDFSFDLYGGSGYSNNWLRGGSGGAMRTSEIAPGAGAEFAIFVGQGGQTDAGGVGGGGNGGNIGNVSSRGFAGGGGTFVFLKTPGGDWQPLAVAGGGGGVGGGNIAGQRGGGFGAAVGDPVDLNGGAAGCPGNAGATPWSAGTTPGCMYNTALGTKAWGPASYTGVGDMQFGQAGNAAAGTNGGNHGGGGGGGYYGGFAGSSGSSQSGQGYAGGGGSGYLATGVTATALTPRVPDFWKSVDGGVTINYRLAAEAGSMTLGASRAAFTHGESTTLTASLECRYGAGGTVVFADGDEQIGTAQLHAGTGAAMEASTDYSPLAAGTHRITASWAGDGALCTASSAEIELRVAPEPFTAAPTPTISGSATVGATLTAAPGAWEPQPDEFRYRWLRDGAPISGATGLSHRLVAADAGHRISFSVEAVRAEFETGLSRSAETGVIAKGRLLVATPKISGTYRVGKRLTVRTGAWGPAGVSVKVQWLRNGKAIRGATKTAYKLVKADRRKRISVRVTGALAGYTTVTKSSVARKTR